MSGRSGAGAVLRGLGACALLASLLLPSYGSGAYADDEAREPLRVQIFHVGALTGGRAQFLGEQPPPVLPGDLADEENPLFGSEAEEAIYPLGQVDELIEVLMGHVDPVSWEVTEGAYMAAVGESALLVKHRPEVLAQVAAYLAQLESRFLQTATVEVRAERTEANEGPERDAESYSVSLTGFLGQRIAAFSGRRHAYLQDYWTEVAQSASASNPVVGVANLGLAVDARVLAGGDARRVTVGLWLRLARIAEQRNVGVGLARNVEAPVFEVVTVRDVLDVKPGVWTELSGHGGEAGWTFHARVTPHLPRPAAAQPELLRLARGSDLKFGVHMLDVTDLGYGVAWVSSENRGPYPSNFTPPEPPEVPEPAPAFSAERLVELLRTAAPGGVWEDPATVEVRNGRLIVRNTPEIVAGIQRTLGTLRKEFLWSLTTRVDMVELPSALLDKLRSDAAGAMVLSPAQARALDQAIEQGQVRRTDRLELTGRGAVMNAIQAGRRIPYVRDYEVKVAQEAHISQPIIGKLFSGLSLAVAPFLASGGKDVVLDVRFHASRQEGALRRTQTPGGNLELPDVDMFRVRTGLLVPLGSTVLLGARGEGDTSRALLLTPRMRARR